MQSIDTLKKISQLAEEETQEKIAKIDAINFHLAAQSVRETNALFLSPTEHSFNLLHRHLYLPQNAQTQNENSVPKLHDSREAQREKPRESKKNTALCFGQFFQICKAHPKTTASFTLATLIIGLSIGIPYGVSKLYDWKNGTDTLDSVNDFFTSRPRDVLGLEVIKTPGVMYGLAVFLVLSVVLLAYYSDQKKKPNHSTVEEQALLGQQQKIMVEN